METRKEFLNRIADYRRGAKTFKKWMKQLLHDALVGAEDARGSAKAALAGLFRRVPGTIHTLRYSGRQYEVQRDGSWRRLSVS